MRNPDQFIVLPSDSIPSYNGQKIRPTDLKNGGFVETTETPRTMPSEELEILNGQLISIKNETDLLNELKNLVTQK